jgi:hypothetical protein
MRLCLPTALLLLSPSLVGAAETKTTPKQALQAFNDLIGSWRGTGEPNGTREEKRNGFWSETIRWEWKFKGDDAWLSASIDKGKHLAAAELHYLPDKDAYKLTVTTPAKESLSFEGKLKDKRLTLERSDEKKKEGQRLVFSFLHSNRHLYRYEVKGENQESFTQVYQVGATKEGVPFADDGSDKPECVVSGGLGTMTVMYKGKTYYVCCSGCRDAFKEEPEKYIKEYEARKAAKKKE